jgi:hypothetical protein
VSMFDWYQPAGDLSSPLCGKPLSEWQGKDGPCGLFVWREGVKHPVDQAIDDPEVRLPSEAWDQFTLPPQFAVYSHDCPDHQPVDAICRTRDGVWSSTVIAMTRAKH